MSKTIWCIIIGIVGLIGSAEFGGLVRIFFASLLFGGIIWLVVKLVKRLKVTK